MPTVEFAGQSVAHQAAPGANSSRLINCYREAVPEGGVTRHIVKPVLGQVLLSDIGSVLQRKIEWVDGAIYSAAGGALYRISEDGTFTNLGAIRDSAETTISGNTDVVAIAAGGKYFTYDGDAITEPTGGAFANVSSVETLGNYTLLTERNGRKFQWSALADAKTLSALNFATTESREDNNLRGVAIAGFYWIFKERSIEVWYPTGQANANAFARVSGGVIDVGLKSFNLITKARSALFFVGSDGIVYVTGGNGIQPVSARAVEESVRRNDATHCFYYEADGHKFCVIRFSDRPAWVYDLATDEWHERSEGRMHGPWCVVGTTQTTSGFWMAASEQGEVIKLDRVWLDRGDEMHRQLVSRTLRVNGQRFRVPELEVFGAYGYNDALGGADFYLEVLDGYLGFDDSYYLDAGTSGSPVPKMVISTSKDSGATWNRPRVRGMGWQGEYQNRVVLRALGQFRTFTAKVDISHDDEMPLYADVVVRVE